MALVAPLEEFCKAGDCRVRQEDRGALDALQTAELRVGDCVTFTGGDAGAVRIKNLVFPQCLESHAFEGGLRVRLARISRERSMDEMAKHGGVDAGHVRHDLAVCPAGRAEQVVEDMVESALLARHDSVAFWYEDEPPRKLQVGERSGDAGKDGGGEGEGIVGIHS